MKPKLHPSGRAGGFSLIEIMMAMVAIAILAGMVVRYHGGRTDSAAFMKLKSDVHIINSAIDAYEAFGGSLAGISAPDAVLAKLKTKADALSAEQTPGLTGSFVDPRIEAKLQSAGDASSDAPRAIYDPAEKQFRIVRGGSAGVKAFVLNEELAALPVAEEARSAPLKYAANDGWIWDYQEQSAMGGTDPTSVDFGSPSSPRTPSLVPPDPAPRVLKKPLYSIVGGKYPISDYTLILYLANPNPYGASRINYQVDSGAWKEYRGVSISVNPGSSVKAYAESINPAWLNSNKAKENYKAAPARLKAPVIKTTADQFDYAENSIVRVIIERSNPADLEVLEYRLDGGPWVPYTGPFPLYALNYETYGADIEARSIAVAEYYKDSPSSYGRVLPPDQLFTISGNADGIFHDPEGPGDLVTNLEEGESADYVTWGRPTGTEVASWLAFTGGLFSDVRPGERFLLGSMDFYNGTIASGTGADSIEFDIELNFNSEFHRSFEFTLDLVNTPNSGVSAWEAADYVHLDSLFASSPATIAGLEFTLRLEFGETTENGFSSMNNFHVLEDAGAAGSLYGTLLMTNK